MSIIVINMKAIILCTFLALGLCSAERDWSQIKSLVAPGLEAFHDLVEGRITGGDEAVPNSIPFQAALLIEVKGGTAFCGGSLISTRYVLTAAHCVDATKSAEVILGAHNVREDEPTQQRFNATKFIVHQGWSRLRLIHDIALVELPEPAVLNEHVQLVTLPKYSEAGNSFNGKITQASGWGKDSDKSNTISPVLRYINSKVIRNFQCSVYYFGIIKSTHLCTSGKERKSTCSGDSGGPLVIENKQVGIVSFGLAFGCEKGIPPAFTRVSKYLDWLASNTDVEIQK